MRVRLLITFITCFGCGLWLVVFDAVVGIACRFANSIHCLLWVWLVGFDTVVECCVYVYYLHSLPALGVACGF